MRLFILFISLLFSIACSNNNGASQDGNGNGNGNGEEPPTEDFTYETAVAFPNLSFSRPITIQDPGDDSGRLFVVEQQGLIRVFDNSQSASEAPTFLDIRDQVDDSGNEEGLLGLAFHPNYKNNGYFYVNYTASNPSRTIISRFQVSLQNTDQADLSSEVEMLSFAQPYANHNGGNLAFGPDGYLYIAVGDGGSGGDPQENAQNRATLLGSILRIDIDNAENGANYGIPAENPYAGNSQGYREEIYAYGLRNPWRFSFDAENGQLWAGDVGQNSYEEIDIIEAGNNYGWDVMEGNHCYEPSSGCDQTGLVLPIWEYGRDLGVSVTGGYVYRGATVGSLTGLYVYGDFGTGRIWAIDNSDPDNPQNTQLINSDLSISSFGVDAEDELYICSFDGSIYTLKETPVE